jgi:hypothetical protein
VPRLYAGIVYGDQNLLPQRAQRTTEEDQVLPLMTLIFGKQIFVPVTVHSCYRTYILGWLYSLLVLSDIYFWLVYKHSALSDVCATFVY